MTPSTPDRRRLPARGSRVLALVPALSVAVALSLFDLLAQPPTAVISLVVVAPLLTALFGTPRDVVAIGCLAIALVLLSGFWRHNFGEVVYLYRTSIVASVSVLTMFTARSRAQVARDRERFAALSAVAEIADGTRSLDDTVARLNEVVVPALADVCIVDAMRQGELRRLAVRAAGRDGEAIASGLAARPPSTVDEPTDPEQPRLVADASDELLRRTAVDAADLERLRALRAVSFAVVPLRARGRRLGTLTLITTAHSGRRYRNEDLEFAKVLAGRAARALDNAGLYSELETIEAQLTVALSTLAEAVTVQHAGGGLIYANGAAARMLGFDSAQELVATPVAEYFERFEATHEDGTPLHLDELPGRRVLAGGEPEPLVVRTVDRASGDETWRVTKASGVYDRDAKLKLVVNVIEDITDVKRAELAQRLLARAGELLAASLDYERTLQQVAELAVPQLADWCTVSLPDGHGLIRTVAVAHVDPERIAFARRLGERYPALADAPTGIAEVVRDGVSQCVNEIHDDMLVVAARDDEHLELLRGVGMRAGLIVPMSASGANVGALSLISAESGRRFSPADVELAEELARRTGVAVENARLYTERSHIARTLQTELLPGRLPEMPGWSVATLYRPAGGENWVGGDYYDAFAVRGGWLAIVGDVAGRGAEAAALTGLARHTLRTAARLLDDPLQAVGTLNAELCARPQMSLCSVVAVLLRERDGNATAEIVCAGHPLPLLARDDEARQVGCFSPMLGAHAVDDWRRTIVALEPADVLVLYTDGVFDAVGEDGRFGEDRLQRTVAGAGDARGAVRRIDRALSAFEVGAQADDTAVLAVQRVAVPAAAGPIAHDLRREGEPRR
ncbi:MAG TPA: SpoIIE family protein phosphatase [Solirubrobacteraceae bacterium]